MGFIKRGDAKIEQVLVEEYSKTTSESVTDKWNQVKAETSSQNDKEAEKH